MHLNEQIILFNAKITYGQITIPFESIILKFSWRLLNVKSESV